jgi:glutamyl/glutaminyl-tRNA synthetase
MRARFNPQEFEPQDFELQHWEPRKLSETSPLPRMEQAWEQFADRLPAYNSASESTRDWFARLMALMQPLVDDPGELAAKAAFLFGFDAEAARAKAENRAVLGADSARIVLAELAERALVHGGPVRPRDFDAWMSEIAAATGFEGRELLEPVRIALTGAIACPELGSLLRLIEDPVARELGIPSMRDRIERFVAM